MVKVKKARASRFKRAVRPLEIGNVRAESVKLRPKLAKLGRKKVMSVQTFEDCISGTYIYNSGRVRKVSNALRKMMVVSRK